MGAPIQHQGLFDSAPTKPQRSGQVGVHRHGKSTGGNGGKTAGRDGGQVVAPGGYAGWRPANVVQTDRTVDGIATRKGFAKRDHVAQRHDRGGRVREVGGPGTEGVRGQSAEGCRERRASVLRSVSQVQQRPQSRASRGGFRYAARGHHGHVPADDGEQKTQGPPDQTGGGPPSSHLSQIIFPAFDEP